ncbi:MAG: hypothetical protein RBR09_13800 [Desulfobulbaceae bacterium]|jgi:uncharacterized protein (DUF1778 family)|nr:hypothetical protein [Lascolabacillus sp.]MDY0352321.1 hypothetical protein [Desulfobulbaceae bacterium]
MAKSTAKEREIRFKVSEEKYELIQKHAERHDETVSAFARHVVMEKVNALEALRAQSVASEMLGLMKMLEESARNENK